jgi:hypothetical protein
MTEKDRLEEELAAFRPHEPSAELKQRIAEDLNPAPRLRQLPHANHIGRYGALAGGLLAAIVGFVLWSGDHQTRERLVPATAIQPSLAAAFDESQPSVWTYRSALTQSPEVLDALLDKHANRPSQSNKAEHTRGDAFARFDSSSKALTGEL